MKRFMEGRITTLFDKISGLEKKFDKMTFQNQLAAKIGRSDELVRWINAISTAEDYDKARCDRIESTCDWILERKEFQTWIAPDGVSDAATILWIRGPAGSGKTFLTTRIIDYLRSRTSVVHFFCYYAHSRKKQPLEIIRSWVLQLVNLSDAACETAKESYREKISDTATESEIWRLFRRVVLQVQHVYFVLDGFDECTGEEYSGRFTSIQNTRERFLNGLCDSLARTRKRVLFVSREDIDISRCVRSSEADAIRWIVYALTPHDTRTDIKKLADTLIEHKLPNKSQDLKEEISADACKRSDGMFLWVINLQRQLKPSFSPPKLRTIVSNTPPGLKQAYGRVMQNIVELDDEDRERAVAILRWVMFARKPLTVQELTEALLVTTDEGDTSGSFPLAMLPDEYDECYRDEEILRLCAPFVRLQGEEANQPIKNQTIEFGHFSVKEYLSSKDIEKEFPKLGETYFTNEVGAHKLLAQVCLRYLYYDDFIQTKNSTQEEFRAKNEKYAFLRYAGGYWTEHKNRCKDLPSEVVMWANRLFDPYAHKWLSYSEVIGSKANHSFRRFMSKFRDSYPNPLFYASLWGMIPTMEFLVNERQAPINKVGGLYGSPLQAASAMGYVAAVRFLLDHDADVNIGGGLWNSPLQAAAAGEWTEIVDLLLEHNANVHAKGGEWNSALIAAASLPRTSQSAKAITMSLLDAGASVHDKRENGETAVHVASSLGCQEVLSLLLQKHADVNMVTNEGWTALHYASVRGDENIITCLLEYGADVNAKDTECLTPLHLAAGAGQAKAMRKLLAHGADVNASSQEDDRMGWTPLHCAAYAGHSAAVKSLLIRNAKIEAIADSSYRPLHLAASEGHAFTVELLLSYGANIEARCETSNVTPLFLAAREDEVSTVQVLLDRGANVTCTELDNGWTPLHRAVRDGHTSVVELLLDYNAPVESRDNAGECAIHIAVHEEQHDLLELLLDSGAEVDAMDSNDYSALILASGQGDMTSMDILLRHGADINKQTSTGQTACSEAIRAQATEMAEVLVERGANPAIIDAYGRSCFDWVAGLKWDGIDVPRLASDVCVIEPTTRLRVQNHYICHAISKIQALTAVDEEDDYQLGRWYEHLGRLLLHRKKNDDACTAFERSSCHMPTRLAPTCDGLDCAGLLTVQVSSGCRFVCCVCTNIDMCELCMEKYDVRGELETAALELCVGHEFVKVPSLAWPHLASGAVNAGGETEVDWLDRLLQTLTGA